MSMQVTNRQGVREDVRFDKILDRIQKLATGLSPKVDPAAVSKATIEGLNDGITTRQLDRLAAETAAGLAGDHPDYAKLAARILVSDLHKQTPDTFSATIDGLYSYIDPVTGKEAGLISDDVYQIVMDNAERLNAAIVYDRDFNYDIFGFSTLERSYLLKVNGEVFERPQNMLMRVAVGIHKEDLDAAIETYNLLSEGYFTHATPTLFNAGTKRSQMSSCFLVDMKEDSLEGIYDTLKTCALISKSAGGLGISISKIRAGGSYIRGTNGTSNGIVPMLRVFNNTMRYVDQGGGKRKGSLAVYIEPWHGDVEAFLDLRKNHGAEEQRARDLFYALWIPDLFMQRVEEDGTWSLMCPDQCPGLTEVYGKEFNALYAKYEAKGKFLKQVKARDLWKKIIDSQIETGTPYMLYKDNVNNKSMQENIGVIRSSNLCTEIVEHTNPDEVAVCNLASIALPKFVKDGQFDHASLYDVVYHVVGNLNKVIDLNYYPVQEAEHSNMQHRPIGLGVQGLADVFAQLKLPFESIDAVELNKEIFETIYFAAVSRSVDEAKANGTYSTYEGSPYSKGQLNFDLWGVTPSDRHDWAALRAQMKEHGVRNSLMVAPMPTASTSQILGNNECFEPFTSNIYTRRTLSGEFVVVNKHLVRDLEEFGIWNRQLKQRIIANQGSVQGIPEIPEEIQERYKTVWEIKQRHVLDMAADRGAFIDQSQSMNVFLEDPNFAKINSMHFYAWRKGLKTGMYYLRTKAAAQAVQFTVEAESKAKRPEASEKINPATGEPYTAEEAEACSILNPEDCDACGS